MISLKKKKSGHRPEAWAGGAMERCVAEKRGEGVEEGSCTVV